MPAYPGVANATAPVASNASPIALEKGESCYVFGKLAAGATQLPVTDINVAAETVAAGTASIAVNLQAGSEAQPVPLVTVEIHFSGAPGVFEIDVQEADTDADAFYLLPSNTAYTINAVSGQNNARVDLSPTGGKYMRLLLKTLTNAVNVWAKITRMA